MEAIQHDSGAPVKVFGPQETHFIRMPNPLFVKSVVSMKSNWTR